MKKYGKRILAAAAGTFALLMIAACGSSMDGAATSQSSPASNGYAGGTSEAYDYGLEMDYETSYDEAEISSDAQKTQQNAALNDRKLIRTVNMDVETKEYDQLLSTLESRVQSVGGYIENLDSYNGSTYSGANRNSRHANLTIRIPRAEMDGFLELVSDVGNVIRRSDSVEDVTLTYVDLESHRNALRTEQDRLLELLEQAESLEDILTIEDRLANIRYQLESMESRLRSMDNQVDYSTLYLDVSEVQELTPVVEQTTWERIKEGFGDSVENIKDGAVEIAVWFMVNSPYLILLAVVVVVFIVIVRASWKKSMGKAAEKRSDVQGSDTPRGDK